MRWWIKLIIAFVFVVLVVYVGISVYLGNSMTRVERIPVEESPAGIALEYEDIEFPSRDAELTMRGWYLASAGSDCIIIMVHGGDMHRADPDINMLGVAAGLVKHKYNVLMFDLRGHGESDGERISAGYFEKNDLLGAVDFAIGLGFERIGVLGFSMGGATALMAAADSPDIDCIVADSCFADLADIMEWEFKARSGFPGYFLSPVLSMVDLLYGVDFTAVRPVAAVPLISPRPILFIHGAEDTFIPLEHAHRLYQASSGTQNELWIAPGAEHVRAYVADPAGYIDRITAFFDAALK